MIWIPHVRLKDGLYIAYAICGDKAEREGAYKDKTTAILSAISFARMLTPKSPYDGKDKLIGHAISQKEIDDTKERHDKAFKVYQERTKHIK